MASRDPLLAILLSAGRTRQFASPSVSAHSPPPAIRVKVVSADPFQPRQSSSEFGHTREVLMESKFDRRRFLKQTAALAGVAAGAGLVAKGQPAQAAQA